VAEIPAVPARHYKKMKRLKNAIDRLVFPIVLKPIDGKSLQQGSFAEYQKNYE